MQTRSRALSVVALAILVSVGYTQISGGAVRQIAALKVLNNAARFHRSLIQYDAEFLLRAYNPLLGHTHHDEFGMWLDKERQTFSLLAIRTELYGQSYTASPAFAQWWEDNQAVSTENPTNLFAIDSPWLGSFADTLVGSLMLDPTYRISEIWGSQPVRETIITEGTLRFRTRGADGNPVEHVFPYWRLQIRTDNYEAVVHVGKDLPFILYYQKLKNGRLLWEESWYPFEWR